MGALTEVAAAAGPYPTRLLERERTALLLFGAAYLGANDGYHIREAGMYATVVDTDDQRLAEMFEVYPATWTFVPKTPTSTRHGAKSQSFDVVSVDCFTGDASALCVKLAPEWTRIARTPSPSRWLCRRGRVRGAGRVAGVADAPHTARAVARLERK
jgi:hypothetical protein